MLLDYVLRKRVPAMRIQAAVWVTTVGGLVAGFGDLHFEPLGYVLALSSAACTACYVVLVGKLGDELQLDSFTLLLYNSLWSTPLSFGITILTGEVTGVMNYPHVSEVAFLAAFTMSCASAFVLNYAGGALPISAVLAMAVTVANYSLSDYYIFKILEVFGEPGDLKASALSACRSSRS